MTTWTTFTDAAPDLAQRARAILAAPVNGVLATIRADGSPRVSGIDPFFLGDHLWFGSMPGARKAQDLQRDPRCALHGVPWESRRVREGAADPGDADAKVAGTARRATDPAELEVVASWFRQEKGMDLPDDSELYILEPASVTVTFVEGEELVIDHWSATGGRSTTRRA